MGILITIELTGERDMKTDGTIDDNVEPMGDFPWQPPKVSESELNDLPAADFKPWDIVMLKGRTGRYRVYEWGRSDFIFACLDADVITTSGRDEVSKILARCR